MRITDRGPWPFVSKAKPDDIKIGEWCMAISCPVTFSTRRHPTVRLGRVYHHCPNDLGTDCTIMGGDSGGALFDLEGHVIGISSTCGSTVVENQHVSIDRFERLWDRLLKGENMTDLEPGYGAVLGVVSDTEADDRRLGRIAADGPAEKAGLKVGDLITRFGGQPITKFDDLSAEIRQHKPEEKVEVEFRRGREVLNVTVTLGKEK